MKQESGFIFNKKNKVLSNEEFLELFKQFQLGDIQARNKIIENNIGIVIDIVNKKYGSSIFENDELIEIGLIVLVRCLDAYDISRNVKFSTYVATCVNNGILAFIRDNKKHNKCVSINSILNNTDVTLEKVLIDNKVDIEYNYEQKELYQTVRNLVENLPSPTKEIVKLYYGFLDDKKHTCRSLEKEFNISRTLISRHLTKANKIIAKELVRLGLLEYKTYANRNKKPENLKTIYHLFKDYTKEEINSMISTLSIEEKQLLILRYGYDLEHPKTNVMWNEQLSDKFYRHLVPKMKIKLQNARVKVKK